MSSPEGPTKYVTRSLSNNVDKIQAPLAVYLENSTSKDSMAQYSPRFQSHYENSLRYDLAEKLCVTNSHQTPKIEKIILSASVSFKPQQVRGPGSNMQGGGSGAQRKIDQGKPSKKKSK